MTPQQFAQAQAQAQQQPPLPLMPPQHQQLQQQQQQQQQQAQQAAFAQHQAVVAAQQVIGVSHSRLGRLSDICLLQAQYERYAGQLPPGLLSPAAVAQAQSQMRQYAML
jgi:hypothetical protein